MANTRSNKDSERSVRDGILATLPSLRAFAISLSGNVDRADDLVQETLLRALANIDSFEPGTNLPAWLFTVKGSTTPLAVVAVDPRWIAPPTVTVPKPLPPQSVNPAPASVDPPGPAVKPS